MSKDHPAILATTGLNIDPMLAVMATECDTLEELNEVLNEIERQEDQARLEDAARRYNASRNNY